MCVLAGAVQANLAVRAVAQLCLLAVQHHPEALVSLAQGDHPTQVLSMNSSVERLAETQPRRPRDRARCRAAFRPTGPLK